MKQGHMAVTVAVPLANVHALARLDGGNRTTSVNRAIQLYLDVREPVTSKGFDADYLRRELLNLACNIELYSGEGLRLELLRLEAKVAGSRGDAEREAINEQV